MLAHLSKEVDFDDNYPEEQTPYQYQERSYRNLKRGDLNVEQSILSQRRDPDLYPELTYLSAAYSQIRLYRW